MSFLRIAAIIVFFPLLLAAQTNCDQGAGPLKPAQPTNISVQEIVHRLSQQDASSKKRRPTLPTLWT